MNVTCICGASTLEPFLTRNNEKAVVSCWIAIDAAGIAIPGCVPDLRTSEVIKRRNAAPATIILTETGADAQTTISAQHDGRDAVVCRCGNPTRESFCRRDPEDEIVSCWITLDEAGFASPGCVPDDRTDPSSHGAIRTYAATSVGCHSF